MGYALLKPTNIVQGLRKPLPYKHRERSQQFEPAAKLDESTNPYGNKYCLYPSLQPDDLKTAYVRATLKADAARGIAKSQFVPQTANLMLTQGSVEGADLILRAYANPGDIACAPIPTFPAYEHFALLNHVSFVNVPTSAEFESASEEILNRNAKFVFICDPNNPTGTRHKDGFIEELLRGTPHGLVIVDEAYIEFSNRPSSLHLCEQYPNLVLLRTLSKAWGNAGLRIGVVIAHHDVIDSLERVQVPFSLSSPAHCQALGDLQDCDRVVNSWKIIRESRDKLIAQLRALNCVHRVIDSDANFILAVFADSRVALKRLHEHRILVSDVGEQIPNAVRISVGTPEQNDILVKTLSEVRP